jgi:pimeloyl-ACP methyl ester carboxylesterase
MSHGTASANGIEIAYETFGRPEDPPVLLITGLGVQMIGWDDTFCQALADRGHHVVRFDNRDAGLSTHFHDAPAPDLMATLMGDRSSAAYDLDDMAADAAGLIAALGLDSAHVVGVSMGGMIAQMVAARHPDRTRSLTSIMSTTGARDVGQASEAGRGVLLLPPVADREASIERAVQVAGVLRSPGFAFDEASIRERAGRSFDRAHDPRGVGRQLVGILASGDRTSALEQISVPTVVIHGRDDPLIAASGGEATAKAIAGAELVLIDGLAHDLPRGVWDQLIEHITAVVRRGEDERTARSSPV